MLYGVDLAAKAGKLDVRSEYLATTSSQTGHHTYAHGGYARGVYGLDPAFLMARYDVVLDGPTIEQRTLDAGAGVQVFPGGEIRGVFTRGFNDETWLVCVQVVGGSTFQPTGLRHLSDE